MSEQTGMRNDCAGWRNARLLIAVTVSVMVAAGLLHFAMALSRPEMPGPPPSLPVVSATVPAQPEPMVEELTPPPAVPARYQGALVRQRVRYFPRKLLALTFDDGPSATLTPQVLDELKARGAHATFFVLGKYVARHPDIVRRAAEEGHAIGAHSYSHPSSASQEEAVSEMSRTAALIEEATGRQPRLFRPPYGITTGNLTAEARRQGYAVILWTISSADSNPIGSTVIASNVIHTPNPGDIVLMHDGPGHKATAEALPQILDELGAVGFEFVTIPELLQAWDAWQSQSGQPAPGPES